MSNRNFILTEDNIKNLINAARASPRGTIPRRPCTRASRV